MDEKKIHSIIDEAMAARDRSVSIYISPDGGVSVSVFPWPDEETLRNMRASGLISHNDYRTRLGLSPMTVLEMDTPDESHATLYAYDKPIYTVEEDK